MNEFHDFREGTALLDLYFGGNRPSVAITMGIVMVFYGLALLASLVFLQPRRSRLQVLDEPPARAVFRRDGKAGRGSGWGNSRLHASAR